MTTLTLLIDERWPDTLAADWALCDSRGVLLQQGHSEPRHWPVAERRAAVLAGAQVSLCAVPLPKARRRDRERLIAYALEERLPTETEGQHFTLLEQEGERAVVAILDAARLRRIVDAFAAIGHPLTTVFGRVQCLPQLPGTAVCVDEGSMRYWRWPDGSGLSEDLPAPGGEQVSWLAVKAVQAAAVERVLGPPQVSEALELPQATGEVQKALQWYLPNSARNLLHGQFSPRQGEAGWWRRLRWPLWITGGAVALHLVAGVVSVLAARQNEAELNAKTRAIFASAFPGAAIVDPVLQMRRQLNESRSKNGALRDDDLLVLLASLSEALGADSRDVVTQLRYEAGVLEISFGKTFAQAQRQALIAALAMRGIAAQPSITAGDNALTLRRGTS
jgi:general secretion pathway protein L